MNVASDAPRSMSTIGGRLDCQGLPMMSSIAVSRELLSGTRDRCRKSGDMNLSACVLVALSVFFVNPVTALADGLPGSSPGCSTTATNPSYTVVSCERTGLDRDGRLLGCRFVLCVRRSSSFNSFRTWYDFSYTKFSINLKSRCSCFLVKKVTYVRILKGARMETLVSDDALATSRYSWIWCTCVRAP